MSVATPHTTAGRQAGFRSLSQETRIAGLEVEGELPRWLSGSLLRTGPAKWEVGERQMAHWFDGLAMLHRFSFSAGAVSYASRFLHTKAWRAASEKGRIEYGEFATDPCRSLFARVSAMFTPKISDNANVNLMRLGERFIAMTETPLPVQFDPDTLETAGVAYQAPGMLSTAHPHMDRASRGMLNYAAKLGPRSSYRFFMLRPEGGAPELLASTRVREPAYIHSFGLSRRWLVLAEFPFTVNPLSLALSGRPYIENYRWHPERPTRFHLFDRTSGQLRGPFESEACFAFHHVNCFEDGGDVVVDLCASADAGVIADLYLERLRAGKGIAPAYLERFRIELSSGRVARERLIEEPIELPRINYGRVNERPYRFAWGVGMGSGWLDRIVKADLSERRSSAWEQEGCYPGEPVFVADPESEREDAGVLLSVVLDGQRGDSFLLVLDAASLSELARARVPHHIPFGFHGQFARS